MPASSYQQQKLRVCEVCCAYLGIHDNDRRLADHFGGKLHLGFIEIREKLANLQVRTSYLILSCRPIIGFCEIIMRTIVIRHVHNVLFIHVKHLVNYE